MKFRIASIHPHDTNTVSVEVKLDDDLTKLLGSSDPTCYTGSISYVFAASASEAVITSAVRNDLTRRKIIAASSGRLAQLVGKEFEV
jgi:hypothetical protein